jgi:hypothetical protein
MPVDLDEFFYVLDSHPGEINADIR